MTSRDFCFWLQGYFEITQVDEKPGLTLAQVDLMRRHLALVFKHEIDPSMGNERAQAELNAIHNGEADKPKPTAQHTEPVYPGPSTGIPGSGLVVRC